MVATAQNDDLNVMGKFLKYEDAKSSLYNHYANQAFLFLDQREADVAKLSTKENWLERQKKVKETLLKIVGPFPGKTPLNPRVTGVIQKDGYHLEKIIFESQPGFYVTAAMFIPEKSKGKTPAIIFASGHYEDAFRRHEYQQVIINFVKKGFVVLAFDPIGQGERVQYYDPGLEKSVVGNCVYEHCYAGAQCLFIGSSMARYMIWDGIRAVDYLLTRKEVDPQRIGITGHSGGGTQSSYIAAFDDRILAVAPECFITNQRRIWEGIGPQDAEQNFYHGIASGIDLPDLLEVRAPKPAMIISTTRDFFSIQGARETEIEVKKIYHAFGQDENFSRVEDDSIHGVTKKNRESRNAFFQKHLNLPGESTDYEVQFLSPEELQITETGQVSTSLGGETVFTLNKKETQNIIGQIVRSREKSDTHLPDCVISAKSLSGYIAPSKIENAVFAGRYQKDNYLIEKYLLKGEGDYPIPFLLFLPDKQTGPPILYLHPMGKEKEAAAGGEIEWLVNQGHPVLAPDLIATGEMGPNLTLWGTFDSNLGTVSYKHWFGSVQIGRSVVGLYAADIQRLVMFLKQRSDIKSEEVFGVAKGNCCPGLLHSAAFENAFSRIALIDPLVSYRSVAMNPYFLGESVPPFVAGALTAYDLPDLAATLAPHRLLYVNARNQLGNTASEQVINEDFAIVKSAYTSVQAEKNLNIVTLPAKQDIKDLFTAWLH